MNSQNVGTCIKKLDVLPLVKHYMDELGLHQLFDKYIPNTNKADIDPAQVLCIMVMNIINARQALYRVEEWLVDYFDGLAEGSELAGKYNDDRLGRTLDLLFGSDRGSMMAELSSKAIEKHALIMDVIHNDTTSVTFTGAHNNPHDDSVQPKIGFNKDHRPDCKQVVFGLNITEDGHIPISYKLYDGNQADVTTHVPNWDELRALIGEEDFIYVADSKLCSLDTLAHIAAHNGHFVTILPRNFKETTGFLKRILEGEDIEWQICHKSPGSRVKGKNNIYLIHEGEQFRDGYRILWIHSSFKDAKDKSTREQRLIKCEEKLSEIAPKINKYNLKSLEQIEAKVKTIISDCANLIRVDIIEQIETKQVKIGKGRKGPNSQYKTEEVISYQLQWHRDEIAITKASRIDGLFPLVDNTALTPIDVLLTYKKQPFLEKRFYTKKSILEVAPVFLKSNQRIEAMMFLYFISLMLVSLVERAIRQEMKNEEIESLPILPSGMKTKTPTWANIQYIFRSIHLAIVNCDEKIIYSSVKGVGKIQTLLLRLLKVPLSIYERLRNGWWEFSDNCYR